MVTKAILETLVRDALSSLGIEPGAVVLERPADMSHGDWATSAALAHAKTKGVAPKVLAEELVSFIERNLPDGVAGVSIAGPGFINFRLSPETFAGSIAAALREDYGNSAIHAGKKILVEHSSPNLFKPFHIGHVMNNAIGESISRLARASGADVSVISYPSDISLGIGKALWAMLEDGEGKLDTFATVPEQLAYLGECYARGTRAFEDQPETQARIREITKHLYDKTPSPELSLYEKGKAINLEYFKGVTARLGSSFDAYIYESEAGAAGEKIVREHIGDVFKESDGAVIYEGEQDGLHTRVFINKEGYPTYEAKDIGLLSLKFGRYEPDTSIFITDHEQGPYFEVVSAAAGKIQKEWQEKTVHRTHGRMTFKGAKMSSRLGGVPLGAALLDAVKEEVLERSPENSSEQADMVAIAALKFAILRAMAGKNINFDPETSLSFEGDSGPYLQYTAVRSASILEKAKGMGLAPAVQSGRTSVSDVERLIAQFSEVVERSIAEWTSHHVAGYLLELARAFNSWYAATKLADTENPEAPHNLAVAAAVSATIRSGLWLLGIKTPERM